MTTRYRFCHAYASSTVGAYAKGDEADFTEEQADFLMRDSPGCIEPVTVADEPVTRQVEETPHDRMVKKDQTRSRGAQEAMSRANSGALAKDK